MALLLRHTHELMDEVSSHTHQLICFTSVYIFSYWEKNFSSLTVSLLLVLWQKFHDFTLICLLSINPHSQLNTIDSQYTHVLYKHTFTEIWRQVDVFCKVPRKFHLYNCTIGVNDYENAQFEALATYACVYMYK